MRRALSASVFPVFDETVLLIHHKMLKLWLPPGGEFEFHLQKIAPNNYQYVMETPLEAAKRELKEETQLDAWWVALSEQQGEPEGYLGYEEHQAGKKGVHLNFDFMAFAKSQAVIGDGSFTQHHWFRFEEVENLEGTTLSVKQFVRKIAGLVEEQKILARLAIVQLQGE